jgi:hypothetical protein
LKPVYAIGETLDLVRFPSLTSDGQQRRWPATWLASSVGPGTCAGMRVAWFPAMMLRWSALVAMLVVALVAPSLAEANRPGRAKPTTPTKLGTFRGPVQVKTSLRVPGLPGGSRTSTMTMKLRRQGREFEVETTDQNGLGPGRPLVTSGTGRIVADRTRGKKTELEVEFGGPAFTQSVEGQLTQALSRVPAARSTPRSRHPRGGRDSQARGGARGPARTLRACRRSRAQHHGARGLNGVTDPRSRRALSCIECSRRRACSSRKSGGIR